MRRLTTSAVAVASVLALSACSTPWNNMPMMYSDSGSVSYSSGGGSVSSIGEPAVVTPDKVISSGTAVLGSSSGISSVDVAATSIIRSGDMSLDTRDVQGVFEKVKTAVTAAGGRIESSSYNAGSQYSQASAQVIARIPEKSLDSTVTAVSALAKRTSLNLNSSDVTLQKVDLEARVKALTAARDRLRTLVAQATKVSDLIAAEEALTSRQAELDSLQGQLDYLNSQVSESTLSIYISDQSTGVTSGLRGWSETFRQMIHGFLGAVQSVIVFAGVALPWLAGLGLLALAIKYVIRGSRRVWVRIRSSRKK